MFQTFCVTEISQFNKNTSAFTSAHQSFGRTVTNDDQETIGINFSSSWLHAERIYVKNELLELIEKIFNTNTKSVKLLANIDEIKIGDYNHKKKIVKAFILITVKCV